VLSRAMADARASEELLRASKLSVRQRLGLD